jgi:hypothetical protein
MSKKNVLFGVGLIAILGYTFYLLQQARKKAIDRQLIIDDLNRYFYGELREKLYRDTQLSENEKRVYFSTMIEPNKKLFMRPRADFLAKGNAGYEGVVFSSSLVNQVLESI